MGIRTPFWGKSLIKNLSDVAVKALDSASKAVEMANKAMDKTGKKSSEVSGGRECGESGHQPDGEACQKN